MRDVTSIQKVKKSELLTDLIHYFNFIFADPTAAVILNILPSLEVLTFNTVPVSESHMLRYDASTVWHVDLVANRCKRTKSTFKSKSGLV